MLALYQARASPCTRSIYIREKGRAASPMSSRMNCLMNSRRGIGPGVACVPGAQPRVSSRAAGRSFSAGTEPAQALVLHTALPAQSPSRTLLPFSLSAPGVPGTVQRVVPGLALSPWTQKPMTELSEQAQGTKSGAWGQNGARRSQSLKHSCKKSLRLRSACPCADAPGQAQAALHLRP